MNLYKQTLAFNLFGGDFINKVINILEDNPIIAAVRDLKHLDAAIACNANVIFMLCGSILNIEEIVKKIKASDKIACINIDFIDGLQRDNAGVDFLKIIGADGIITTKPSLIKEARYNEIFAIQRLFMVDSRSLKTGIRSIKEEQPDAIEIMPGIACKVIKKIQAEVDTPVIAGGLIDEKDDIIEALSKGAIAVSTGSINLWNE